MSKTKALWDWLGCIGRKYTAPKLDNLNNINKEVKMNETKAQRLRREWIEKNLRWEGNEYWIENEFIGMVRYENGLWEEMSMKNDGVLKWYTSWEPQDGLKTKGLYERMWSDLYFFKPQRDWWGKMIEEWNNETIKEMGIETKKTVQPIKIERVIAHGNVVTYEYPIFSINGEHVGYINMQDCRGKFVDKVPEKGEVSYCIMDGIDTKSLYMTFDQFKTIDEAVDFGKLYFEKKYLNCTQWRSEFDRLGKNKEDEEPQPVQTPPLLRSYDDLFDKVLLKSIDKLYTHYQYDVDIFAKELVDFANAVIKEMKLSKKRDEEVENQELYTG